MAQTGFATDGDTVYVYQEATAGSTSVGVDADDSNKFKIATNSKTQTDAGYLPFSTNNLSIDPATNGDVTVSPNGTGKLQLTNGNFDIPATNALTNGMITMNSSPFAHIGVGGTTKFSTFLGINAGFSITTGTTNTGIGQAALVSLTSGSYNTVLGFQAGHNLTTESSNILIGHPGSAAVDNTIKIGRSGSGNGQQNQCFIAGIDGVNVGSVSKVVTMASDQLGTATITAGSGISITPGANTITIAATTGAFTWNVVTGASQTIAVENGYLSNRAGLVTYTLPATANVGDMFRVSLINAAGSWTIVQNVGQTIKFGSVDTTVTTGSLSSTANGDAVEIVCTVANTNFMVLSSIGNITFV